MKLKHLSRAGAAFAGLILMSCAAEIPLEDEATATAKQENLKRIMNYEVDQGAWLPARVNSNLQFGVTGHPIEKIAYDMNGSIQSINKQLDYIKELGMTYYRVPIEHQNGISVLNSTRFADLISAANTKGIKLLPGILNNQIYNENLTNLQAYNMGKTITTNFLNSYGQYFDYYEIGNELDLWMQISYDGSTIQQYNQTRLQIVANYFRGMIERIRIQDPTAKVIINNAGWIHTAYFKYLSEYLSGYVSQYNLDFDIMGLHWYSNMGTLSKARNGDPAGPDYGKILDSYASACPGKKIWITEINRDHGSNFPVNGNGFFPELNDSNPETEQSKWLQNYIRELDNYRPDLIEAFFVYELYDMPAENATFGLLKWQTQYTTAIKKPAFNTVKLFVEETKYGYEDFVRKMYRTLNANTSVNPTGLSTWVTTLKNNRNKYNTAGEFMKDVYFERFVNKLFLDFENNSNPSLSARTYWINQMKNGYSQESAIMDFCHGTTFYDLAGGTNYGFVNRLYIKLMGRTASADVINEKANRLNNGTATKGMIIAEMLYHEEYYTKFVKEQYMTLLQRNVTATDGLTYWVGQMNNGVKQLELIKSLISLNEFWESALIQGYEIRTGTTF